MKNCPFCAEEIQDAAVVCRFCQRAVPAPAAAPPEQRAKNRRQVKVALGIIAAMALLAILTTWFGPEPPTSRVGISSPSAAAPETELLVLLSSRGYESESGGYWYVEGEVRNISDQPLKSVQVVASWFTKDATLITSDSALVEYNPLMPGQTTPFKTITRGNPLMSTYTVGFKQFSRGSIATRDDRKQGRAK